MTIENADKLYKTIKPTDAATMNKIMEFAQDKDYKFQDERRGGQSRSRSRHQQPQMPHQLRQSRSNQNLLDQNNSLEKRGRLWGQLPGNQVLMMEGYDARSNQNGAVERSKFETAM